MGYNKIREKQQKPDYKITMAYYTRFHNLKRFPRHFLFAEVKIFNTTPRVYENNTLLMIYMFLILQNVNLTPATKTRTSLEKVGRII